MTKEATRAELELALGGPFVGLDLAAEVLGVSPRKLRLLIVEGELRGSFKGGGSGNCHWLVPVPRLKAWLERQQKRDHFAPRPARTRSEQASHNALSGVARRAAKGAAKVKPPPPKPSPPSRPPAPTPVVLTTVAVTRQPETLWLFPEDVAEADEPARMPSRRRTHG